MNITAIIDINANTNEVVNATNFSRINFILVLSGINLNNIITPLNT